MKAIIDNKVHTSDVHGPASGREPGQARPKRGSYHLYDIGLALPGRAVWLTARVFMI